MVKRTKIQHNDHVCDDCKWREWHKQQWNLDIDGKPLT